jgi:hypothetical protein
VGLAAVVLEEHAGRTVQLRHDHALGAVDHERTGMRHQRDFAHVHFVLAHFLHGRLGGFLVHDGQAHARAQRRSVGQPALLAFLDVERRHAQRIRHEVEARILGMALDRKDGVERGLQALVLALLRRQVRLQECAVGFQLRGQQKRHRQCTDTFCKAFTNALFFGKRIAHDFSTTGVKDKGQKAPIALVDRWLLGHVLKAAKG